MDDQVISFSEDDARNIHHPHDDALVVTLTIAGLLTRRVLIDNGSSADIIYLPAYQQMKIDNEQLKPIDIPLVGFTGDKFGSGFPHYRSRNVPETSENLDRVPCGRLPLSL